MTLIEFNLDLVICYFWGGWVAFLSILSQLLLLLFRDQLRYNLGICRGLDSVDHVMKI